MKKILSVILCVIIVVSTICVAAGVITSAAAAQINYNFFGTHAKDRGWAQGDIIINAGPDTGGNYYLYWANDTKALDGYDYIAKFNVAANGSSKFTMPEYTAIPADATKIIGIISSAEPSNKNVSAATAVYDIPAEKRIGQTSSQKLYSFASYSDFHISEGGYGLTNYPYDNEHELAAWNVAANRGVDFVVTTGDHINNQRADDNGGNNPYLAAEWRTYLKNLAKSEYTGPVYEAIGNHELWNYDTESSYRNMDWQTGSKAFVGVTGLDSTSTSVNSGKAYYEITEPKTGDHFLFMALEGGFYTDRVDEFSDAQLTWLENKLKAYQNDGHNIFILEHSNFYKWGAGDRLTKPVYDIPLKDTNPSTVKLKNLLQTYKTPIFICGHTHFKFSLQHNYSDNSGTSATIIHNSSVGAVRDMNPNKTGTDARINDHSLEQTEGYVVEVYNGATIFYGVNLYYNKIIPTATYMVETAQQTSQIETEPPTQAPSTQAQTQAPVYHYSVEPSAPYEKGSGTDSEFYVSSADDDNISNHFKALYIDGYKLTNSRYTVSSTSPNAMTFAIDSSYLESLSNGSHEVEFSFNSDFVVCDLIITSAPITPTSKPVVWGDVNRSGGLDVLDATDIQKSLASIITLDEEQQMLAKVDGGDKVNVLDATLIQKRLASIISSFPVEEALAPVGADIEIAEEAAEVEFEVAANDLNTLRTQAKTALDKYYALASYDQYQALKKAYKENADYSTLSTAYNNLSGAVASFYGSSQITLIFNNNKNWSNVYAYCWDDSGTKNAAWPGQKCTKSGSQCKITVDRGKYVYVIFNNGSNQQTVDLPLFDLPNIKYTPNSSSSKYKVKYE